MKEQRAAGVYAGRCDATGTNPPAGVTTGAYSSTQSLRALRQRQTPTPTATPASSTHGFTNPNSCTDAIPNADTHGDAHTHAATLHILHGYYRSGIDSSGDDRYRQPLRRLRHNCRPAIFLHSV